MLSGNRDLGLTEIRPRRQHRCYGMGLGVMLVDDVFPGFPGDMRNASAYPFPVQYEIVEGVGFDQLIYAADKTPCLAPIVVAARRLADLGCRAIAAECGYFAYFQPEVARAVDVPVFMSSLLQVPLARTVIGAHQSVGMLVAFSEHLTDEHLRAVGIIPGDCYKIAGIYESGRCPTFVNLYHEPDPQRRCAEYAVVERELVTLATEFYEQNPTMGAMVIECGAAQPFARAIQRRIDIPVLSWGTLLDYAYSVVVHRDFFGHV